MCFFVYSIEAARQEYLFILTLAGVPGVARVNKVTIS